MKKAFCDVFANVALSKEVKLIFEQTFVYALKIDERKNSLFIGIEVNRVYTKEEKELLKEELMEKIGVLEKIELEMIYKGEERTQEEIFGEYWIELQKETMKESIICGKILEEATWQKKENGIENQIEIFVKHNNAFFMTQKKCHLILEKRLLKETKQKYQIYFKDMKLSTEERQQLIEEKQQKEKAVMKQIKEASAHTFHSAKEKEETILLEEGVLFGKMFKGKSRAILEVELEENPSVIIEGYVFHVEAREIKNEQYIVSFDITDFTDSFTIKFFVKEKLYEKVIQEKLKNEVYVCVQGKVQFDMYAKEYNMIAKNIVEATSNFVVRRDEAEDKRVELHLHTQMSSMDGISSIKSYMKRAKEYGHQAIAITDHGVVQAFPDAMKEGKKHGIKVIYGVEAYLVDDLGTVVTMPQGQTLEDTFVVFDVETTGLSKEVDMITEIGAVKICKGEILEKFSTFVNPQRPLTRQITQLTGITDNMLKDAPTIETALPKFLEFAGESVLVAHNANFDMGFLRVLGEKHCNLEVTPTYLDTLELSQVLLTELKKHKLNGICAYLGISLEQHHRAVHDAQATAEIFLKLVEMLKKQDVHTLDEVNIFSGRVINYKKLKRRHAIILAKNQKGLRHLYELISVSHLEYFFKKPLIPKSALLKHREGLILGSACEAGELYQAILDASPKQVLKKIVNFYDYLEIQPLENNQFLIDSPKIQAVQTKQDLIRINEQIIKLGEEYQKPVVATCDVHFLEPEDAQFRKIILKGNGFNDVETQPLLYYRTTEEMLESFSYLGAEKAKEVVVTNTNLIADSIEDLLPIPKETFPPKIEGANEELRKICMEKAVSMYGEELPAIVLERLEIELNSIISNGYAVLYIIAQKLVWKSMEDGYLVGSRGSVGSSFAAFMAGITEVNSLPPHYICKHCKYSDFDSELVKSYAMEEACGCDMENRDCPVCGEQLYKDGHDIPFQTFLGFEGDKEPDIDLNFSGEYQQTAHTYTEELFGEGHVFKAGTIGTLADKTAFGYVKKYFDEKQETPKNAQIRRLTMGCTGIKKTTGQHPGGLMVVPQGHDIHEFCPIQRPANSMDSTVITTHFDYHSISGRLLKLDLLGHDDPTIIRMLHDLTGINPQDVSLDDQETISLFQSPKALGVTEEEIQCQTGTLGVPEFGTQFVRGMLLDTKPKTFADLIRISGLSHGTDVWLSNAQTLIEENTITLKDTISTRDGIMIYLINKGVEKQKAFKIMEQVRKGNGLTEEQEADMIACGVPDWYIWSCKKIKYMFPKAHAAAYVMMAFRIAYFKINYPVEYYATYFTIRASDDFDYDTMCHGIQKARNTIKELKSKGNEMTKKDKDKITVLEIVVEFYARGLHFYTIDLYESDSTKFLVKDGSLLPPLNSLQGLGITAAESIVESRKAGTFDTLEQLKERTSVGKSLIELLKERDILKGIPESNQVSLFD